MYIEWFYGVVVSTLDFESSDLGSTPGRTCFYFIAKFFLFTKKMKEAHPCKCTKHIKLNNALKLTYNEYNALRQLLY